MKTIITTIAALLLTVTTTFAQKEGPMLGAVSLTQPTCYGSSNGQITINTSGGLAPYTYLWSTGDTTQTISNLSAGNYSVLVSDAAGNTMGSMLTVPQPAQITVSGTVINTPMNTSNGSIDVISIDNTVGNYTYVWSSNNGQPMNQSTLDQTGLKSGNYKIYITDENGCEGVGYFQVNSYIAPFNGTGFKIKPSINNTTAISTYPNPSNGNFTIEVKENVNEIKVVNTQTGEEVINSNGFESKLEINNLPSGVYMIYAIGKNGTSVERITVL